MVLGKDRPLSAELMNDGKPVASEDDGEQDQRER
jgi:hypothetical protein